VRRFALVRQSDVRGLLHCHTAYADGAHNLRARVETARDLGLEYLGITDKARSDYCADGLSLGAIARQREEIEALNEELTDFRVLHGVEVETCPAGDLPVEEKTLAGFDYVVATLKACHDLDRETYTGRALRAIMNPYVTVLGHPVGHYMTSAADLPLDLDTVLRAAATARVAVEFDANPDHPDLDWRHCTRAQSLGVTLVIASDAHRAARLADYRHGAELSRSAGLCSNQILNTQPVDAVLDFFRRG
jgi:DNA polymerase (family 10)